MSTGNPAIRVVLFDIDGVLTDGRVWITPSGGESKVITFEDIDAIFSLKRAGVIVAFITGEDTAPEVAGEEPSSEEAAVGWSDNGDENKDNEEVSL